MKFGRAIASAAVTLSLAGSALFAAPAAAFADEADDLAAVQQEIESQADERQEAQNAVDALDENSTTEDVAAAYSAVSSLSDYSSLMTTGKSASLQLQFAQLQAQLAEQNRQYALDKITEIQKRQDEHDAFNACIDKARRAQANTEAYSGKDPDTENKDYKAIKAATDEVVAFMNERGMTAPTPKKGAGKMYDASEWKTIITLLQQQMENLDAENQQIAQLQDFMNQYNQYLQGVSSAIANGSSASSAAGTMLGENGGTGMLFTGVLAGLVVGVAGTLVVVRLKDRKPSADRAA